MRSPGARLLVVGAAVTGIALRLWLMFGVRYFEEDALITLRFGHNLIHGRGWVYNPGERVLGTTSPLWTVVAAAVAPLGVAGARVALVVICLVAYLVAAAALVQRTHRFRSFGDVGTATLALVLALHGLVLSVSVGGMEESLFLLLLVGAVLHLERSPTRALALAGLATLARPEGVVVAVALVVVLLLRDRDVRRLLGPAVAFLAVVGPWVVFATIYFGSPIPQSAKAKSGWFGEDVSVRSVVWRPSELYHLVARFSGTQFERVPSAVQLVITVAACALFAVGLRRALGRRTEVALALSAFFFGYVAFYYFGRGVLFPWYTMPPTVAFWVTACMGVDALATQLRRWQQLAVLGLVVCLLGIQVVVRFPGVVDVQRFEDAVRQPAGAWIARCTDPDATVMLEPLGYVGYYADRRVTDLAGLITPRFVELNASGPVGWPADEIQRERPDYLVLRRYELEENRFLSDSDEPVFRDAAARHRFDDTYSTVASFGRTPVSLVIYARRSVHPTCS